MTFEETLELTNIMLHSGDVVDFSHIEGIKVDKHSTGGVGDKTSLILAPVVAAAGVYVPMISGRGLGHTGGTLDKLESIPGFNVNLSLEEFKKMVQEIGTSLIGQTAEIAPADKKLYALRDVTATVECIPLITSSIMSKKLAEGIDALVLDIKFGSGAFMKTEEQALELGQALVKVGSLAGKQVIGLLTDMNAPLGNMIGNWLEVRESIDCLNNNGPDDLMELSLYLSGTMIYLGGKAGSIQEGYDIAKKMITSGKAMEKWIEIVEWQGGDTSYIKNPEKYELPEYIIEVPSTKTGYIESIDAYTLGVLSVELGAGRTRKEDPVDPQAGIVIHKRIGEAVATGETLCRLFTNKKPDEGFIENAIRAFKISSDQKEKSRDLIRKLITDKEIIPWNQYLKKK
jgi:pyrimidine-nucleoside phosphorylase